MLNQFSRTQLLLGADNMDLQEAVSVRLYW